MNHHDLMRGRGLNRRLTTAALPAALMAALLGLGACAGQGTGLGLQLVSPTQVAELGEQSWAPIKGQTPAATDAGAKERVDRVASRAQIGRTTCRGRGVQLG